VKASLGDGKLNLLLDLIRNDSILAFFHFLKFHMHDILRGGLCRKIDDLPQTTGPSPRWIQEYAQSFVNLG
jgi:hypothetical protein